MKNLIWIHMMCASLVLTGCDQINALTHRKAKDQKSPVVAAVTANAQVDDVQLAKIILKPKRHKLSVTRDPFEPLIKPKNSDGTVQSVEEIQQADTLKGMHYLGMVKVGNDISALIKTEHAKDVYKVNDEVNLLKIKTIEEDSITFSKEGKTFKLKRGVL